MTATVRHLPTANPSLDEIAATLTEGQWVRVTWHDKANGGSQGVVEGTVRRPSHLTRTLFVGLLCLTASGHLNIDVTDIETTKRPDLDMEQLAPLMEDWAAAMVALEEKPIGRFKTGDNTAEANAVYVCEQAVRSYLRGVRA